LIDRSNHVAKVLDTCVISESAEYMTSDGQDFDPQTITLSGQFEKEEIGKEMEFEISFTISKILEQVKTPKSPTKY